MTSKTKEFKLNEKVKFSNELIYFFNINPYNSSIYISLEIYGKKIKLDYSDKIILKEIFQDEVKELNYNINDDVELNMIFKIVNKFNKKEIFESFQTKMRESKALWNQKKLNEGMVYGCGISIKDRIKMFSGGDNTKKQNVTSNYKPGKLKMPNIFQKSNKNSIKSSHSNISRDDIKKSIKKGSLKNIDIFENKEEIKDLNKIQIRKSDTTQMNDKIEKKNNNENTNNDAKIKIKNENEKNIEGNCEYLNLNKKEDNSKEQNIGDDIEKKNNNKEINSELLDIKEEKENEEEIKMINKDLKKIKNIVEKIEKKEENNNNYIKEGEINDSQNENRIKEKNAEKPQNCNLINEQKDEIKEKKENKSKKKNIEIKEKEIKEENKTEKEEIIDVKEVNIKEEFNLNNNKGKSINEINKNEEINDNGKNVNEVNNDKEIKSNENGVVEMKIVVSLRNLFYKVDKNET